MAQRWRVKVGTTVRYRDASNRVHHAVVTLVTSQTLVNLRVGRDLAVTGVSRVANETPGAAGWYRHGSDF